MAKNLHVRSRWETIRQDLLTRTYAFPHHQPFAPSGTLTCESRLHPNLCYLWQEAVAEKVGQRAEMDSMAPHEREGKMKQHGQVTGSVDPQLPRETDWVGVGASPVKHS